MLVGARLKIADRSLQVLDCAAGAPNLLISDRPVITSSRARPRRLNPAQYVALGDATMMGMPIGPRTFVCLHCRPERHTVQTDDIITFNSWQYRVRDEYLMRRPLSATS